MPVTFVFRAVPHRHDEPVTAEVVLRAFVVGGLPAVPGLSIGALVLVAVSGVLTLWRVWCAGRVDGYRPPARPVIA